MGCGPGGRALVWGARGREFESHHSNLIAKRCKIRERAYIS